MNTAVNAMLTLNMKRMFPASRERVFAAWTDPAAIGQWFAPDPHMTTIVDQLELKPGGLYRIRFTNPTGEVYVVSGEYIRIQPADQLVFTWRWQHDADRVMLVTLDFIGKGEETELRLTHEKLPDLASKDHHVMGWKGCLSGLETYLSERTE